MLILLVALIQAAPAPALAADPVQAAMTCRSATLAGWNPLPLEIAARHLYFTMAAARALPGNDDYFQRMAAIASRPYPRVRPEDAQRIGDLCDRLHPPARRTGPVALPADAFDRDMMCAGAAAGFSGTARAHAERNGDTAPSTRLDALVARYQPRAIAGMIERRMTTADVQRRAIGDQLFATLDLGNLAVVTDACEAQLPGD
ncbi:MAG TPA: hypothetical protein VGO55_14515 [Allosphingosinicella sp.]|nr:hypothetical protein [Allosphingosinicella sp.]